MKKTLPQKIKAIVILQILCACLMGSTALAQNIRNEKMDVKYVLPPSHPLPVTASKYRISVDLISLASDDSREGLTAAIKSNAKLYGNYTEVSSGADVEIYVRLDRFTAEDPHVESRQVTTEKSDKTKVTTTVYDGITHVAYPMLVRIKDLKEDKILWEGFVENSDRFRKEMVTGRATSQAARNDLNQIIIERKKELRTRVLNGLSYLITHTFSFYPTEQRWSINYVETSKKENYDDVMAAKEATKASLDSLSNKSTSISDATRTAMQDAIAKWESILKESDLENRKARIDKKVSQAILENLAYCNFFIRNYTEAEKYRAVAKEHNKQQWQYDLEEQMKSMKQRCEANSITFQ